MNKPRVLVVDDDKLIRKMLQDDLTAAGYHVQTASTGEEAFKLMPKFKPEAVILDVIMPGENGYRVCRAIKELTSNAGVAGPRVVLLTSRRVDDDAERESVLLGFSHADAMLYKPCDAAHLREVLAKLLAPSTV